jgi:hypothetical protein
MKITVILKNVTDQFHANLAAMQTAEQLEYLFKGSRPYSGLERCISVKIETGQFRDAVEFNALKRQPMDVTLVSEPRKGYRLLTFTCVKAAA